MKEPCKQSGSTNRLRRISLTQDLYSRHTEEEYCYLLQHSEEAFNPRDLNDPFYAPEKDFYDKIQELVNLDVIVINSAGNHTEEPGDYGGFRSAVDTIPAVFEGPDFPLIVIAATDLTGKPASFSQGEDKVTVLAPGEDTTCLKNGQTVPDIDKYSSTSFAVPLVAGVIANFLAYDTIPWDMSDGKVAANAKEYLQETANWERVQGTKVIWNGLSEQDNLKKPAPPPPCPPRPSTPPGPSPPPANNLGIAGPAPATAPYAQGTCGIHVTEWRNPFDQSGSFDLKSP